MGKDVDKCLADLYYNLDNPESYSSIEKVYRAAKKKIPQLKKKDVKIWFQKQPAATLHKPVRFIFPRNKTFFLRDSSLNGPGVCSVLNL